MTNPVHVHAPYNFWTVLGRLVAGCTMLSMLAMCGDCAGCFDIAEVIAAVKSK